MLLHDLHAHQEREEEFILFEERTTNILVEKGGEFLDEEVLAFVSLILVNLAFSPIKGTLVNHAEELERVLIHGINVHQVTEDEEEARDTRGDGDEDFSDCLDLFHGRLHLLEGLFDPLALLL